MRPTVLFALLVSSTILTAQQPLAIDETTPPASDNYPLTPDSLPQPGRPTGTVFKFEMNDSKVFPNTARTITVYIPAAYDGTTPACLYVGLDGLGFNATTVFDNLIAEHAIPVTIAVGISSGAVSSAKPPENPRLDRSFEFDSLTDRLVRFINDEVLPEVRQKAAARGRPLVFSINANDHAIGGASTGAIAALNAAWQRPDLFSRVFSAIGTYVGMRGGEGFYVLVRKTEPKPLRIFMQDGVHDEWGGGPEIGDWWMSNQTMERALTFAGYDVRHVWGTGTHNDSQASMLFPEAMRWLWRDWPAPIKSGESRNPVLKAILNPGEDWQIAGSACPSAVQLAANAHGDVLPCSAIAKPPSLAKGVRTTAFTVRNNGDTYACVERPNKGGELWLIRANGHKTKLDTGIDGPSGFAFSPDGLWLFVAQSRSKYGLNYRVLSDGTIDSREPFYAFEVPASTNDSGATAVAMDKDGRAYVGTRLGIQVFDRNGRVVAILPLPGNGAVTGLCFGGIQFDTLYAATAGKLYKRKLRVAGLPPRAGPIALPPWGAG